MPIKSRLLGSGVPPLQAQTIGGTVTTGLTATGNSQGTALLVTNDLNVLGTVAASTGVILRADLAAGDSQIVVNNGANALAVYPPVGGKLNNGTTNASVAVAAGKAVECICIDSLNFTCLISA